jgi:alpha-amylase
MKKFCLYFQVHQPFRLRRYRFFDIGHDHYYFDDFSNRSILQKIAHNCYLPMNALLKKLIETNGGNFKVAFSLTGTAIEQFEQYAPEVLESFRGLADTGCVEFLGETYSHSLVALRDEDEFKNQISQHSDKIFAHFGQKPSVFRNTELIYSDRIGGIVSELGFKAILTEGAKHILGWKSPNYIYCNSENPKLKILLRNYKLSDDIGFRFSNREWCEWPLTADKYSNWIGQQEANDEVVNVFMDYETFGEHQSASTGIFDFFKALPKAILENTDYKFATPSEVADQLEPIGVLNVPHPISWADEERDITAWLGNNLQREAFDNLYALKDQICLIEDPEIHSHWQKLQTSDHFYYMCTKYFSDGAVHMYFNPYSSPYEAFLNYMNVLSDFSERVKNYLPPKHENSDIDAEIDAMEAELKRLKEKKSAKASQFKQTI